MPREKTNTEKAGEKKQTPEIPVKKEPKKPTLKENIDKTVDTHIENKDELKKQIFGLIQRVLYPDQFCPDCDDRLFFGSNGWSCPNCGFQRQPDQTPQLTPQSIVRPSQIGKVPPQVEKMIEAAQEPRRVVAPTKKGKSIRELVDQLDSGGPSAPTPQDEGKVRSDRNVSGQINWV